MAAHDILMSAAGIGDDKLYVEDVFGTYLYTGNAAARSIDNGVDLAGKGGMVWLKERNGGSSHFLYDTSRGAGAYVYSNQTAEQTIDFSTLSSFNSTGFSLGADSNGRGTNRNGYAYTSWTFRKAPKFFDVVRYTGNNSSNRQLTHSLGQAPGMIIVKNITTGGYNWFVWHKSLPDLFNQSLYLNLTNGVSGSGGNWGSSSPTATNFYVNNQANTNNDQFVAYLYADDFSTDSLIRCGNLSDSGSGLGGYVFLGWEPQYILMKRYDSTGDWQVFDTARGLVGYDAATQSQAALYPNNGNTETSVSGTVYINSGGFGYVIGAGAQAIYMAIRRGPMRTPADGTKVFSPLTYSASTGTARTTGFPVDTQIKTTRAVGFGRYVTDRVRGVQTTTSATSMPYLLTNLANAETKTSSVTNNWGSTGYADASLFSGYSEIDWNFRRAPGFFDVVSYSGGHFRQTVTHNLGVPAELAIFKARSTSNNWVVVGTALGSSFLNLNGTGAAATGFNFVTTSTNFTIDQLDSTFQGQIAYLFASCPGVSKVGTYAGTGTAQNINCGFTTGSRFVMIKRTNSTGDWYVWDSARGIVTGGNDPFSLMNTATAETTNTNYINQLSTGFSITSTAPAAINASGGTYIFLAIA